MEILKRFEFDVTLESGMETKALLLNLVTEDYLLASDRATYNRLEWKKVIERYKKHNATFFSIGIGNYSFEEFIAIYEVDGIRFVQKLSYSGMLSNSDFLFYYLQEKNNKFFLVRNSYNKYIQSNARPYLKYFTSNDYLGMKSCFTKETI